MSLGPHTVTLLRDAPAQTDEYGNESGRDWANATRTDVTGCSVQGPNPSEYQIDREAVVTRYTVYLPGLYDIDSAAARAEWKGKQYEIDSAGEWDFEPLAHTVLLMRRVTG